MSFSSSFPIVARYADLRAGWDNPGQRQQNLQLYQDSQLSFVPNLLPEDAVQLTVTETLAILQARWGERVALALHPDHTDPTQFPHALPLELQSYTVQQTDTEWLKTSNMVGINVRTIGTFWAVIPYALTLSNIQDSIHLLPIWEPGVVGSIYGMSSWNLNTVFYSPELAQACPWLNTVERQLRAVVNLLHMQGKAVGMDVIPHTDRFSEMALAHPEYFEWVQRRDTEIVDYTATVHEKVQGRILNFLDIYGPAIEGETVPRSRDEFYNAGIPEKQRLRVLFGFPSDAVARLARRKQLIRWLYGYGYETIPATMAPPYRGLAVDTRPEALIVDEAGLKWRDYRITAPEPMSRVFGPLTRYKLYERVDDASWALDFARPVQATWDYISGHYAQIQRQYGFDFMRGDMSHVQMRPEGVPAQPDAYYDILGAVKHRIQTENSQPSFGYFAETFLAPPGVMGYGVEIDHLEAAGADTTLGDLQSTMVGSPEFLQRLRQYDDVARTRACVPNLTVMTADKDDPRFDSFYRGGNEVRLLLALGLTDRPSYMALGFETRDIHLEPAPNEHYTKLFVFHETSGPKATHGPYRWGQNGALFAAVTRVRLYMENILPFIKERRKRWLLPPDATAGHRVLAWTQAGAVPEYVFVVNTDTEQGAPPFALPGFAGVRSKRLLYDFSTIADAAEDLVFNGVHYPVAGLAAGGGRVYKVEHGA